MNEKVKDKNNVYVFTSKTLFNYIKSGYFMHI